jgi:DNA-directed RNA polymerase subunit RPC12/RpoP
MEHTTQPTFRCPRCRSRRVRLSRFRFWELVVGLLLLRPYRCCKCSARFWEFRSLAWPTFRRSRPGLTLDDLRRMPFDPQHLTPV